MKTIKMMAPESMSIESAMELAIAEANCAFGICNDTKRRIIELAVLSGSDTEGTIDRLKELGFSEVPSLMSRISEKIKSVFNRGN